MWMALRLAPLWAALLAACPGGAGGGADTAGDDGVADAAAEVAEDTAPSCESVALDCQAAAGESCRPCFEAIARCCYDDPELHGVIDALAASCELRGECRRCCDECAALDCPTLRAKQLCPYAVTPAP